MEDNKVCMRYYECMGNCWFNLSSSHFDIWDIVSKKCKGTKSEQKLIEDVFHNEIDKKELINKYDFSEEEKIVLAKFGYK